MSRNKFVNLRPTHDTDDKKILPICHSRCGALQSAAAQPRLIVQIVVGSMRGEDLDRYAANFGEGGFCRLTEGGTVYADSRYDYLQTTTPVSLATLTTGAMPSTHGVIGSRWVDYTTNQDRRTHRRTPGSRSLQPDRPDALGTLLRHAPGSRAVTVAAEAVSAVVTAGHGREVFWLDSARCDWVTSPYYAPAVPGMDRPQQPRALQPLVHLDRVAHAPRTRPLPQHAQPRHRAGGQEPERTGPERLGTPEADQRFRTPALHPGR